MIDSRFGALNSCRAMIGKAAIAACLTFLAAVNPANLSYGAEPTLEDTVKFLQSYFVAHTEIEGYQVDALIFLDREMVVDIRSGPGSSWEMRWLFELDKMSTEIPGQNNTISLSCVSDTCIKSIRLNNNEVKRGRRLAKIDLVITSETMAARIKNALTHAIKLGGGSKPAF